jgi:hypothetical protein
VSTSKKRIKCPHSVISEEATLAKRWAILVGLEVCLANASLAKKKPMKEPLFHQTGVVLVTEIIDRSIIFDRRI